MHASLVTFVFIVLSAAPSLSAPISEVQERFLCGDASALGPLPCPPARPLYPNENLLSQIEDKRSINGIQLLPGETNAFFSDEMAHPKRFACGPGTGVPTCPVLPPDPLGLRAGETYSKRSINAFQLLPGETNPFFPEETSHSKRFACGDDVGFPCPERHLPPGEVAFKRSIADSFAEEHASLGPGRIVIDAKRSIAFVPKTITKMPGHISPPIGAIEGADTDTGLPGDISGSDNDRRSFIGTAKSILDGNLYGVGMTV